MIRQPLLLTLTMATIAACWLWKDSYRIRPDRLDKANVPKGAIPDYMDMVGLFAWGQGEWNGDHLYLRTFCGTLSLADFPSLDADADYATKDAGLFGMAYFQSFRGRQLSIRFIALVIVLGCFPAWTLTRALLRRLRRYRRRRRGSNSLLPVRVRHPERL